MTAPKGMVQGSTIVKEIKTDADGTRTIVYGSTTIKK